MPNYKLILAALAAIVMNSIPAYGMQNCCSLMTISLQSSEPISLDGFSVSLDNRAIGVTDYSGILFVSLDDISPGNHNVVAIRQERDGSKYAGKAPIPIPCINASSGRECSCLIIVARSR